MGAVLGRRKERSGATRAKGSRGLLCWRRPAQSPPPQRNASLSGSINPERPIVPERHRRASQRVQPVQKPLPGASEPVRPLPQVVPPPVPRRFSTHQGKGLTPHQGPDRVFGEFRCDTCRRSWCSGNSWADAGQQCLKCNIMVYPHTQMALQKAQSLNRDKCDPRKRHLRHLCGKCKSLGYNCRDSYM